MLWSSRAPLLAQKTTISHLIRSQSEPLDPLLGHSRAMVKSRFSSLDVRAMAPRFDFVSDLIRCEVNSVRPSVVGCKVSNIYDINSKVYLLKLQRKGFRCLLLLESGVRFHLTEYQREKSNIPSNYTMKLRKHLRNRRVTRVSQLGADRAIDIQFGRGHGAENR